MGRGLHPSNYNFSVWVELKGFSDIDNATRSDAMWFASHWVEVEALHFLPSYRDGKASEFTHPKNIRQRYNERAKAIPLPDSLADLTITEKPTATLDQRSAEKLAKVINRAQPGDEGSKTAKRHVESIAKKHGVSVVELREVVPLPCYIVHEHHGGGTLLNTSFILHIYL